MGAKRGFQPASPARIAVILRRLLAFSAGGRGKGKKVERGDGHDSNMSPTKIRIGKRDERAQIRSGPIIRASLFAANLISRSFGGAFFFLPARQGTGFSCAHHTLHTHTCTHKTLPCCLPVISGHLLTERGGGERLRFCHLRRNRVTVRPRALSHGLER